jgi:hypothetical protein
MLESVNSEFDSENPSATKSEKKDNRLTKVDDQLNSPSKLGAVFLKAKSNLQQNESKTSTSLISQAEFSINFASPTQNYNNGARNKNRWEPK